MIPLTCRRCGAFNAERHHAVNRSLGGHNGPLVELCRACHQAAHSKSWDVASVMSQDEQAEAVRIIGLGRAHRLLCPTAYKHGVLKEAA